MLVFVPQYLTLVKLGSRSIMLKSHESKHKTYLVAVVDHADVLQLTKVRLYAFIQIL